MATLRFHALNAYPASILGRTNLSVWIDPPPTHQFRGRQLQIELTSDPLHALPGHVAWTDVDVDTHVDSGGLTQLGPDWPSFKWKSAMYVSDHYLKRMQLDLGSYYPPDGRDYEYAMIMEVDEQRQLITRYLGFHARYRPDPAGDLLDVWHAATSQQPGAQPAAQLPAARLADPAFCHAASLVSPTSTENVLYLERTTASAMGLMGPKLPIGQG